MGDNIIIGVGGDSESGMGIYSLAWNRSQNPNGCNIEKPRFAEQVAIVDTDPKMAYFQHTPRSLATIDNSLYLYSREGILSISVDGKSFSYKSLKNKGRVDLGEDGLNNRIFQHAPEDAGRVSFLLSNELIRAQMTKVGRDLVLSTWVSDNEEWRKLFSKTPEMKKYGQGGYLFVAPDGDLDRLVHVPDAKPTGPFSFSQSCIYSCAENGIQILAVVNGTYALKSHIQSTDSILGVCASSSHLLWTDRQGGFHIRNKDGITWNSTTNHEKHVIFDETKMSLPSESSSCAFMEYDGSQYILLGLDDCKLRIYRLRQNVPYYEKTVSLISLDSKVREDSQDDHITSIKCNNDYVQVSMRKCYLRWGMGRLLELPDQICIPRELDLPEDNDYLHHMRSTYGLESIVRVPHRITCFDVWSVK